MAFQGTLSGWIKTRKSHSLTPNHFFGWGRLNDEQTHVAFHSMNYLFRGFDRMRMERKMDKERSLEDFEVFLNDMNKLGIQNELVWGITAYLNLKKRGQRNHFRHWKNEQKPFIF